MKIQLKRSNVLEGSVAKQPSSNQMEYGEVAINYSQTDPAIFLKDSNNDIIRIAGDGAKGTFDGDYQSLTNKPTIGDGSITINNADGSQNATFTVNQTGNSTVTLPAGFSGNYNDLVNQPTIGDGLITLNDANGVEVGTFTANQTSPKVITLPAGFSGDYDDLTNLPTIGNGSITFNQGGAQVGSITVNQVGNTTIDFSAGAIYTAEAGKGISINASNEISIGNNWSNIPALPNT